MAYFVYLVGTIVLFTAGLGIALFIHEWGHYVCARLVGVQVAAVRLGAGPSMMKFRYRGGPEWHFSPLFFLGGKTVFVGEGAQSPVGSKGPYLYHQLPRSKKIFIILGGPLANFLFPALILTWLLFFGILDATPTVREPVAGSFAQRVGVRDGDRLTHVDGRPIGSWWQLEKQLANAVRTGRPVSLARVTRDGKNISTQVDPLLARKLASIGRPTENLGLFRIRGDAQPVVGRVVAGSPAHQAGFELGDTIVSIDQTPVASWAALSRLVEGKAGQSVQVNFVRDGLYRTTQVRPSTRDYGLIKMGTLGILPLYPLDSPTIVRSQRKVVLTEALKGSTLFVFGVAQLVIEDVFEYAFGRRPVFSRTPVIAAESLKDSMSNGPFRLVALLLTLSICIGWFNLLPAPPLDGGQLLKELVRRKRWTST